MPPMPDSFRIFKKNTPCRGSRRGVHIFWTRFIGFSIRHGRDADEASELFGGGVGAGVKVTPVAFLIIKEGNVRMLPVTAPANTTADRLVEMVPDTLDKIAAFIDSRSEKKAE